MTKFCDRSFTLDGLRLGSWLGVVILYGVTILRVVHISTFVCRAGGQKYYNQYVPILYKIMTEG